MHSYIIGYNCGIDVEDIQYIPADTPTMALNIYKEEHHMSDIDKLIVIGEKLDGCIVIDPDAGKLAMNHIIGDTVNVTDYVVVSPIVMAYDK